MSPLTMADLPLRPYILQAHHNPLTNTGASREEEEIGSEFQQILVLYNISNLRQKFSMLFLLDNIPSAHIKDRLCRYCLAIGHAELHRIAALLRTAKRNVNGILFFDVGYSTVQCVVSSCGCLYYCSWEISFFFVASINLVSVWPFIFLILTKVTAGQLPFSVACRVLQL